MQRPPINGDQLTGLYAAALEAIPRPIIVADHETVLFANAAAALQFGAADASEMVGLPVRELLHPDSYDAAALRHRLLREARHALSSLPTKAIGRDASIISARINAHPVEFDGTFAIVYTNELSGDGENHS